VFGEEKTRQVHDMELLLIPKQVYDQIIYHFKDINIVIIDDSSYDVETHMLKENKTTQSAF
jgi:hypothetical protein